MNRRLLSSLACVALLTLSGASFGQAPNLGSASGFALFTANGAFSNVGASVVTGDVGTNVGAYTAFPPGTLVGQPYLPGSTQAQQAATDVAAAYNSLASAACTTTILPELGGQTLTPGVSCQNTATATSLNGILTLNGAGTYIIRLNSALTTATSSSIVLTNGATFDNVFFQVNGAVDVGIGSVFKGTILANGAIRLLEGSSLEGRGLSIGGAISVSNSIVTIVIPALSLTATPAACAPATNAYSVSGVVSLTNVPAGTVALTDGPFSTTVAVNAGDSSVPYSLTGLTSGTGSHTVTASYAGRVASATYTAPASCTVASASLGGYVFTDNNQDGIQNGTDTPLPGVVVTLLSSSSAPVTSTTTDPSGLYSFTGLTPGVPYSVSVTTPANYSATSGSNISGPVTLTSGENNTGLSAGYFVPAPKLTLALLVDKSTTRVGTVLTYTIVVANTGSSPATNVVVNDSTSAGLTYVPNSVVVPIGTVFTPGTPISSWVIPTLNGGESFSLTFQATADSTGILYSTVTLRGDTVKVCTSIPAKLCPGDTYILSVPAGRANYRWYKDGVLIAGQTSNELTVTGPGSYSLGIDNAGSQCPDYSCCPFIVEEDSLPVYRAVAVATTCQGNTPQANGQLVLTNFNATYTYQYSLGTAFNAAASLSGASKPIPGNGVIATTLANPATAQPYTVRVYNSSGCYTDVTVVLMPTTCACPVQSCIPVVIQKTRRVAVR